MEDLVEEATLRVNMLTIEASVCCGGVGTERRVRSSGRRLLLKPLPPPSCQSACIPENR